MAPAAPASAQSSSSGCRGGSGLVSADVIIDEPARNAVLSGKDVVVRGSARARLGQLSRVEVTLAGQTKVDTSSPSGEIEYNVSFDVSNAPPGETSLQVVACGAFSLAGSLARGEREIPVRIQNVSTPVTTTTSVPRTTVVSPASVPPLPGGTTSTSVAVTTTQAGQAAQAGATASSSTTVTSAPAGEEAAAPALAQPRTQPARPQSPDAPLVLAEAQDDRSERPPLWVGAVVGISGGLGLLFSARSGWRRGRLPEAVEPLEPAEAGPDLVDVR